MNKEKKCILIVIIRTLSNRPIRLQGQTYLVDLCSSIILENEARHSKTETQTTRMVREETHCSSRPVSKASDKDSTLRTVIVWRSRRDSPRIHHVTDGLRIKSLPPTLDLVRVCCTVGLRSRHSLVLWSSLYVAILRSTHVQKRVLKLHNIISVRM